MDPLNYHHLRYFREVAHAGNLTQTAERLNVSQSSVSVAIKQLEHRLGQPLFERVGRRLELTEVGRIALDHADRIFDTGQELVQTLSRAGSSLPPLRVGALSTLSRNFQLRFLKPAIDAGAEVVLRSGTEEALLDGLRTLSLDVVLSTEPPRGGSTALIAHKLAEQPVGLHGKLSEMAYATLPNLLRGGRFIVPTESSIRSGFVSLAAGMGIEPRIIADVDDMAMVRLLAREGAGIAVAPAVVLADELSSGRLTSAPFELQIFERFFAITLRRDYPHPLLGSLLETDRRS